MVLIMLTPSEAKTLTRIVKSLTVRDRLDYAHYAAGKGYAPGFVDEFTDCDAMERKGWVYGARGILDTTGVFLTKQAWERFSLAEWHDVEEEAMRAVRGETYGSW